MRRAQQPMRFHCFPLVGPPAADLQRIAADIDAKRAAGQPTVPSLLGDERKCNPFLRPSEFWQGVVLLQLQHTLELTRG